MQETEQTTENISAAVICGPVQDSAEEPEEAHSIKHIAKELFPAGEHHPGQAHDFANCHI